MPALVACMQPTQSLVEVWGWALGANAEILNDAQMAADSRGWLRSRHSLGCDTAQAQESR